MSKNIIVTGGTGFLGSSLINTFDNSYNIINVGRNKVEKCENIYWDLKDSIDGISLPHSIDTIIHCASIVGNTKYTARSYMEINTISTLELLEYCIKRGAEQFIYISTGGVYGFGEGPFIETEECNPRGIYSLTKYFSEKLCKEYADKIKITIVRVFFPYGEDQKGRLISELIYNIKNGNEISLNNDGKPFINPIYIEDLSNMIKGLLDKRIEGTFNAGGNEIVSIKQLCEIIANKLQIKDLKYKNSNKSCGNILGDNRKIIEALSYSMKTNLSDGIDRILKHD